MKKFQNRNDVVLTMTEEEYIMLRVLITSGIIRKEEQNFFSYEMIEKFRKVRDEICDYE